MRPFLVPTIVALVVFGVAPLAEAQGKGGQAPKVSTVAEAPVCAAVPETDAPLLCSCPEGAAGGSVWGSGPYTADSSICAAAQHAGVIGPKGGVLQLVRRPGQSSYAGSDANGISTSSWGAYGQSFEVLAAAAVVTPSQPDCDVLPGDADRLTCGCRADIGGSVWGSGPYTQDSNICTAARHAGAIGSEGGSVTVLRVPGLPAYTGSERNGEVTSGWGSYDGSIVFDRN